jgi:hypothetical protein
MKSHATVSSFVTLERIRGRKETFVLIFLRQSLIIIVWVDFEMLGSRVPPASAF